jgi:hypothetical protein
MAKIEINQVAEIIKRHKIEPSVLREIVEEMNAATQPAEGEDVAPPAQKKQYVVLFSDPEGKLGSLADSLVAWVLQCPEEASPHSVVDRIHKASYDFNASKRGRMLPVKSVGEALESVGTKFFKESEIWVKTKLPVFVMLTDNTLPKDEFHHIDKRRAAE